MTQVKTIATASWMISLSQDACFAAFSPNELYSGETRTNHGVRPSQAIDARTVNFPLR